MRPYKQFPWLVFVSVGITISAVLSIALGISQTIIIVMLIISGWVLISIAIWRRANIASTGKEWWQDDDCSGWRGY